MTTVKQIIEVMERIAPPWMACEGDPTGLQAGDPAGRVRRLMVTLDATLPVIRFALQHGAEMIITHHPRFYQGLKNLDESSFLGRIGAEIARARLAIYSAHTNLDVAPGGVNDCLAHVIGLEATAPLQIVAHDPLLKMAIFVPPSHLHAVREAVAQAGAGVIGEYTECSFRTSGIGSFRGSDASSPFLGQAGRYEEVEEWRLEVLLTQSIRSTVEAALRKAHPYEEPAYDLYRLDDAKRYGLGRVGHLRRPEVLRTLAKRIQRAISAPSVGVLGNPQRKIERLAVWSGGGCPVENVATSGVDALVVGEIRYHDLEILEEAHIACIAVGHASSEMVVLSPLAERLQKEFPHVAVSIHREGHPELGSLR